MLDEAKPAMQGEDGGPDTKGGESDGGAGRMWGLLQDLLAAHGRDGTAALLKVSERTLRRAESNRHDHAAVAEGA